MPNVARFAPLSTCLLLGLAGCHVTATGATSSALSSDAGQETPIVDAGATGLTNRCTDSLSAIYAAPSALTAAPGSILACAAGATLTAAQIQQGFATSGTTARPPTSGAVEYLVQYVTQRATNPATPGFASAAVFFPDTPRAAALPVVTIAHPTAGEGAGCAESRSKDVDPTTDLFPLIFTLVGQGFAVIVSDGAGYAGYGAPGNAPMGYLFAQDEAMGVLDAARALRALRPALFSDSVVLVGYSQGGHSVLSSLAIADSYGAGGDVVGVVAYSPLWFNAGTWGAIFFEGADYLLDDPGALGAIRFDVWYHYTHAEILDGPGHGTDPFAAPYRDAVKSFIDTDCDPGGDSGALSSLPGTITDLYDPDFVAAVSKSQALGRPCPSDPVQGPLCTTWAARYAADRPHIGGHAATVPTLLVRGGQDDVIPPGRFVCGTDRLTSDGVNYSVCLEPGADHGGTLRLRGDYVSQWVAHVGLGEADPGACPLGLAAIADDAGPIPCDTPPAND